jgi:hypothetical protein
MNAVNNSSFVAKKRQGIAVNKRHKANLTESRIALRQFIDE